MRNIDSFINEGGQSGRSDADEIIASINKLLERNGKNGGLRVVHGGASSSMGGAYSITADDGGRNVYTTESKAGMAELKAWAAGVRYVLE
jgi:hypothetical protein